MATKSEIVAEWAKKADELKEVNAELQTAKVKLDELRNEIESIIIWKQEQLKEIEEKQKQLQLDQEAFEASIDRTHLKLAISVDELNDLIIERQDFIRDLDIRIETLKRDIDKLEMYKVDLVANLQTLKAQEVALKTITIPGLQTKIGEEKRELESTENARDRAIKSLDVALQKEGELAKRERDLKINEIRIRNYYKKAGLIMPE